MPRYKVKIGEEPFEFDWDKQEAPTQDAILDLYKKRTPPKGTVRKVWDTLTTPLTDTPSRWGKSVSNYLRADSNDSPAWARTKGFFGGAAEGAGDVATQMTSPLDLAATATGLGAVRRAAPALNTAYKVASAATGVRGAENIIEGGMEGDLGKVGAGGVESALSLIGMRSPVPAKKPLIGQTAAPAPKPITPDSIANPLKISIPNNAPGARVNPVSGGLTSASSVTRVPNPGIGTYGIKGSNDFPSVPDRMKKPSTNQEVFDALLPSRIKEQIGQTTKLPNPDVTPFDLNAQSNIAEPVKKLVSSSDPIIQKAAQEVVAANTTKSKTNAVKRMAEEWLYKPMISVIKQDSDNGKEISRMMERAYADYSAWAGQTSNKIGKAVANLSKEELDNLPFAIQGKAVPLSANVQKVMNTFKTIDEEFMQRATSSGLQMRTAAGKTVPFAKQDNYWARIYPDEFIKQRQNDMYEELIAKGLAPEQATNILENSRAFGNRLIDPQHGRYADVEGYRLDVDSQKHHYNDLARRIVEAEVFGNMDTASPDTPISKLLAGTNDKKRIKGLVDQYLGRGSDTDSTFVHDVVNPINKFQVAVQLPLFAIKNQSQKAMIPIRGNIAEFAKALGEYTTKEGKDLAENTGALQSIRDIIYEMGGESKISKYYGISKTEEGNRSLAALTGKGTAARLFDGLKKNPGDKIAREKLDDLLLEDVDTVLKQDSLTEAQMNRAGFRLAELTQGSANPMYIPSRWSKHPEVKLLTLYKRYAIQQSKLIKDSIMQDWKKNLPTALIALTAAGEITGSAHAGVKAVLQGENPGEKIAERGSDNFVNDMMTNITGDKDAGFLAGRVARDLSDSMALGIIQDFIESAGGKTSGLLEFLAGPTVGNASKLASATGRSVREGSVRPVMKEATKQAVPSPINIPISNLFGKEKEKKRGLMP